MLPDALNYLSFIIALLCTAPPAIGLCHYMNYVIGVLYLCNDTVSRIEQTLKNIEEMERTEEEACRIPPPYLYEHIRTCKIDFANLRGLSESVTIRQSPRKLVSALCHIVNRDAVVCRLLEVEKNLDTLLVKWKEKSDLAVMTNYGGHLPMPSSTAAPMETGIQSPSLPALELPKSIPEGVSTGTLIGPSQIEQPVRGSQVDNESDLESNSGSEAGSTSAHESQGDTDAEVPHVLPTTLPRVRSVKSCRPLRRKRSILNVQDDTDDDRAFLTMYTSNPTVSPCHRDSCARLGSSSPPQRPRLPTGGGPSRPPVITECLQRSGDTCEGEITPTALHNDIVTQSYDSMTRNTTPTSFQMPTPHMLPLPPPSPIRMGMPSRC